VAARFDPAMFAVYAVGCLQIPLVDVIATSSANVMMVKMADAGFDKRGPASLALWHATMTRLAFVIVPLAVFLLIMARDIIVVLFTSTYLPSVPIFRLWTLTILLAVPCVDAVLRANAQTRFLLALNVLRLVTVIGFISWFLDAYGLPGAVLITLASTALVRVIGIARIAYLFGVGAAELFPWKELGRIALFATIAAVPAFWIADVAPLPRLLVLIGAATVYGITYFALSAAGNRQSADDASTPSSACLAEARPIE
jgi:O-antigen/teichoic acid export membrane protein